MKNREIKVHINPSDIENAHFKVWVNDAHETIPETYLIAKLIIEIPEKKIEITESQLAEAIEEAMRDNYLKEKIDEWRSKNKF